ncbi:MAG: MFS transporter [Xenococcus sp. (in: cyanobacteria)]
MNQNKIKLVLFASIFIDFIGLGIHFPLLPFSAQKFDADPREIGLLFALYSLMQFIFAPLWGSLSDRFGRRIILLVSIAGSGLSYLWFAWANSLLSLFLARALAGIMGNSALVAKAYMADITTPENRTKAMGLLGAAFGLGFTVGPALGGILAGSDPQNPNFQLPFLVAAGLSLVAIIFAFFNLPELSRSNLKVRSENQSLPSSLANIGEIFRHSHVKWLIGLFFIISFATTGVYSILAVWCVRQWDSWGPQQTGYLFIYCGLLGAYFQTGAIAALRKKLDDNRLLLWALGILGWGFFVLPLSREYYLLVGAMTLATIGESIARPTLNSLLSQSTKKELGKTLGIAQSFGALGQIIGPAWAGTIFSSWGFSWPFWSAAAFLFVPLYFSQKTSSRINRNE